jgi:C-terminal processing protease CtpA/Prc
MVPPPSAVLDSLIHRLRSSYVFPDRAAEAEQLLRTRLGAGAYPSVAGPALCEQINADLLEVTDDRHLRLIWHQVADPGQDVEELVSELRERFRRENHGVRRAERLPGNVGLIELTAIPELSAAAPTLEAAMRLVEHTEALIVDLRPTLGGSPDAVAFLASFLFPDGETRLSDIVEGPHGPTRQFWTVDYLSVPRYLDREVYVLTSADTFSGGEALAYDLQALGRAIIIGESTRGGAHPSEVVSLVPHIELRLPTARTVSPITGGNWEGVGVQPDVQVAAHEALTTAYIRALTAIAGDPSRSPVSRDEAADALDQERLT